MSDEQFENFTFTETTPEGQAALWMALAKTERQFREEAEDKLAKARAELSALRAAQPLTREVIEQIRELLKERGRNEASIDLINDISARLDSLADGETK